MKINRYDLGFVGAQIIVVAGMAGFMMSFTEFPKVLHNLVPNLPFCIGGGLMLAGISALSMIGGVKMATFCKEASVWDDVFGERNRKIANLKRREQIAQQKAANALIN